MISEQVIGVQVKVSGLQVKKKGGNKFIPTGKGRMNK